MTFHLAFNAVAAASHRGGTGGRVRRVDAWRRRVQRRLLTFCIGPQCHINPMGLQASMTRAQTATLCLTSTPKLTTTSSSRSTRTGSSRILASDTEPPPVSPAPVETCPYLKVTCRLRALRAANIVYQPCQPLSLKLVIRCSALEYYVV